MGGKTVAEAKERVSYQEYLSWLSFRRQHGPLAMQLRQERIAAAQMFQLSKLHGGKGQVDDFMIWTKPDEQEISLEQALEKWV
ncbi:phage tail assembly protein T [Arsukibacterium sp. UBA3155]|uniref:phage tail assembly protein T n=1 Tax=Arsukibacterium sp. UBA3155 TaxID=1946058 RepID=UPI003BB9873F